MCSKLLVVCFSQPLPPSSRPPVTRYKISHNTTAGSTLINQTNYTTFVVDDVVPGVYLFTVVAVNALGDGEEESTSIIVSGHNYSFDEFV